MRTYVKAAVETTGRIMDTDWPGTASAHKATEGGGGGSLAAVRRVSESTATTRGREGRRILFLHVRPCMHACMLLRACTCN